MATRKASKGKTAQKSPARKKAARRTAARKKPARKKASARPKTPTAEAIARKIVRATKDPSKLVVEDLYAEDCVSEEAGGGEPAVGHEAIKAKNAFWEEFQDSSKTVWTPKNTFTKKNLICIEWQADVAARDGRSLTLQETAIHELRGGKIVRERYYYDPSVIGPPAEEAAEPPAPTPEPPKPAVQPAAPSVPTAGTGPDPDPIDL